jgi:predicted secreted protein with PEFG-CTERM motif
LASSILLGISAGNNSVFADHPQVDINIAPGSNVPGCEDTDECYIPHEVTVDVGGEVIWTNDGSSRTTVTSGTAADGPDGMFDSGLIEPGGSFSFKFEEHGEYHYFSMIHPWMQGVVIVQEGDSEDEHGEDEEHGDSHSEKEKHGDEHESDEMMMHMEGDATATGMLSDGTMVLIWTSEPTAGERMEISIEFKDSEHVNHDVKVTQNGKEVLHDEGAHHHEGKGVHETMPLDSSDPVDITITFQGYGVDDPKTGPIGEEVIFSNVVPEFGTIAMLILALAIISIVAVSTKSRISLMPRV